MADSSAADAAAAAATAALNTTAASARAIASHAAYLRRPLPLTAVAIACSARPELDALTHLTSSFIDTGGRRWTIERACELGDVRLLQRLIAHESSIHTHPRYRSHVFSRALVHAVRHDSLEMLEWLLSYCPDGLASKGIEEAAAQGNIRALDWLLTHCHNILWSRAFADAAGRRGHLRVLEWLHAHAPTPSTFLVGGVKPAAARGHVETVQWLLATLQSRQDIVSIKRAAFWSAAENGHPAILQLIQDTCEGRHFAAALQSESDKSRAHPIDAAVESGSLETTEWLHANGYCGHTTLALERATQSGRLALVRWLLAAAPDVKPTAAAVHRAAETGHLAIAQLLYSTEAVAVDFDSSVLTKAAERGHLDVVQWLVPILVASDADPDDRHSERRTGFGYRGALLGAARHGHLEVVQWLYRHLRPHVPEPDDVEEDPYGSLEQYFPADDIDEDAVSDAASNGHDDIVVWLHARWSSDRRPVYYVREVAARGDLKRVQWLIANSDALVNERLVRAAAKSGDLVVLTYVSGFVDVRESTWAMAEAAGNNQLETVQWLVARGAPAYRALAYAVQSDHLRVAKWLYANAPLDSSTEDVLSRAKSVEMVQWLLTTAFRGGETSKTMAEAAERGDLDTLLLLHETRGARCSAAAAAGAIGYDHVDVFEWILETFKDAIAIQDVRRRVNQSERRVLYEPQALAV